MKIYYRRKIKRLLDEALLEKDKEYEAFFRESLYHFFTHRYYRAYHLDFNGNYRMYIERMHELGNYAFDLCYLDETYTWVMVLSMDYLPNQDKLRREKLSSESG